jgi:tRNA(Arg) A34 adenosine deaminase TadA
MCAAAIFQAKIPDVKMGLTRNDLSSFLRSREIDIHKLADDSGYKISISSGLLKEQIFEQFKDIIS